MSLRIIYYDTETTGISADKDNIIEIAAYDLDNDTSFVELVNPERPIPPGATAIHHITDEMVSSAPTFADIGKRFIEFCHGEVVLIAHNNDNFDIHFLRNEFERHDMKMPESWKFIDSLKWARRYRPDLPKHTLQYLREIYGIQINNAHRAMDDVIILHKVFSAMIKDLPIETVYNLISQKRKITSMPFGKHKGKPLDKVPKDYIEWLTDNGAMDKTENNELRECFEKLGFLKAKPDS